MIKTFIRATVAVIALSLACWAQGQGGKIGGGGASTNPTSGTIPVKCASAFCDTPVTVSPASTAGTVTVFPSAAVVPFANRLALGDTTSHIYEARDANNNIRFFVGPDGSANCLTAVGGSCIASFVGAFGVAATPGTGNIGFNSVTNSNWSALENRFHLGYNGVDNGPLATQNDLTFRRNIQCVNDTRTGAFVCSPAYPFCITGTPTYPSATATLAAAVFTTGAVATNAAGEDLCPANPQFATGDGFYLHVRSKLSSAVDVRFWAGMSTATAVTHAASDILGGADYAAFHACKETTPTNCATAGSSLAAQTTNFQCILHNSGATVTAVDSGVALDALLHDFEITENPGVGYTFRIDGNVVCGGTILTTLPTSNVGVSPFYIVTTQVASTKALSVERLYVSAVH